MNEDSTDPLQAFDGAAIYDPLSEVTRAERRLLLIISVVCLALTWADLLPTEIEALGIAVKSENRQALVWLLGAAEIYLLAGFIIYALADKSKWDLERSRVQFDSAKSLRPIADQLSKNTGSLEELQKFGPILDRAKIGAAALRNAKIRAWFEFYLPPIVSLVALSSVAAEFLNFSSPTEPLLYLYRTSPRGYQSVAVLLLLIGLLRFSIFPRWKRGGISKIEWVTRLFRIARVLPKGSAPQKFAIWLATRLLDQMASRGPTKSTTDGRSGSGDL